jgi:hypothetical protein
MFVALGIKHAKCMRRITLSSATCTTVPYFSALWRKLHDFRIKVAEHKVCVVIFLYNFCLKYFPFYDKFSDILSQKYVDLHIKYPLSMLDINEIWFFPTESSKLKFQPNPFNGNRVVPYGQTDGKAWRSQYSLFGILRTRLKTIISLYELSSLFYITKAKCV